jgi:long-subunit acyl-CoA synthetase (AMP-forming)
VFEGYGLSECGSVVCLNTPGATRPGSVGRPLPHVRVTLAADGEVFVQGQPFAGYLGQAPRARAGGDGWPTGDLGRLDDDGFLYLTGRRRSVFITAYGRNVAPEWVERELALEPAVAQAAVFGEARPWNVAVIVPASGVDAAAVASAVRRANLGLPDYARVSQWLPADGPFTPGNGLLTGTGRVRRQAVQDRYRDRIETLYRQEIAS